MCVWFLGILICFCFPALEISKESINGIQMEYIDISPLPMLNTDLEVDGEYPPVVEAFRRRILEADSILFASPEYNYSITGISSQRFLLLFFCNSLVQFFGIHLFIFSVSYRILYSANQSQ